MRTNYEGGSSGAIAPDELRAAASAFTRRLAVKMTAEGLPKVSYSPSPEARLFGDEDGWAQFFGTADEYLNAVRAAAPLRVADHVFSFSHKSLQEFSVAAEVVASVNKAMNATGMTAAELQDVCEALEATPWKDDARSPSPGRPKFARSRSEITSALLASSVRRNSGSDDGGLETVAEEPSDDLGAAARRQAAALETLTRVLRESALGRCELHMEEAVRDFLVDVVLGDLGFAVKVRAVRRFCVGGGSVHGGALDRAAANLAALIVRVLPRREGGTLLHAAAAEGNMHVVRLALDEARRREGQEHVGKRATTAGLGSPLAKRSISFPKSGSRDKVAKGLGKSSSRGRLGETGDGGGESYENARDDCGRTALFIAASMGEAEVVAELLASGVNGGVDVSARALLMSTPGEGGAETRLVTRLGKEQTQGNSPALEAASRGHFGVAKAILREDEMRRARSAKVHGESEWSRANPWVDQDHQFRRTPLHYIAAAGDLEFARKALEHGGAAACHVLDAAGRYPVELAAMHLHATVLELLLDASPAAAFKGEWPELRVVDMRRGMCTEVDFSEAPSALGAVGAAMLAGLVALNAACKGGGSLNSLDLADSDLTAALGTLDIFGFTQLCAAIGANGTIAGLSLADNDLEDHAGTLIAAALREQRSLTAVDLRNNVFGSEGLCAIFSALRDNSANQIRSLDLGSCVRELHTGPSAFNGDAAKALAEYISGSTALRSVNVLRSLHAGDDDEEGKQTALSSSKMLAVVARMKKNVSLCGIRPDQTEASLQYTPNSRGGAPLQPSDAVLLASDLSANHVSGALRSLNLAGNRLCGVDVSRDSSEARGAHEAAGIVLLAKAIKNNSVLTCLDLSSNAIRAPGAAALAEALKADGLSPLARLSLESNDLGAAGAAALAEGLTGNRSLTYLNLKGNDLAGRRRLHRVNPSEVSGKSKEVGATVSCQGGFMKVLQVHTDGKLRMVDLSGAKALGGALKVNRVLATLDLSDNDLGAEGAAALAEGLKASAHSIAPLLLHAMLCYAMLCYEGQRRPGVDQLRGRQRPAAPRQRAAQRVGVDHRRRLLQQGRQGGLDRRLEGAHRPRGRQGDRRGAASEREPGADPTRPLRRHAVRRRRRERRRRRLLRGEGLGHRGRRA